MRRSYLVILLAFLAVGMLTGPAQAWYPSTPQVEVATRTT